MGRRKIEIQPITHERNRSVTFLKRKNGLFKKAYELGVLCSVDVAVIIFEERPGHHVKLYQYCSADIHDMVQRHIRYDGEKDTRTPGDFSNNPASKLDDAVDGDDDDMEDDDGHDLIPSRTGTNKKAQATNGKPKSDYHSLNGKLTGPGNNDLSPDQIDYLAQRPLALPQAPMSLHHPSQMSPSTTTGSSLPISGERHSTSLVRSTQQSTLPNKRPRLAPSSSMGKDDHSSFGYNSSSSSGFRHPQQHATPQFNPFLATSPPLPATTSSFLNGFEFPSSNTAQPPARGPQRMSGSFPPPRSGQYPSDQHQPGIYQQLMRHGGHPSSSPTVSGPSPDLFAAFLDADEQRQAQNHAQQFSSLDWPVHAGQTQQNQQEHPPAPPSSAANADSTWLDFLSGNAPPPIGSTSAPPRSSSGSWDRDRVEGEGFRSSVSDQRSSARRSPSSVNALSPTTALKRARADSTVKTEDGHEGNETKMANGSSVEERSQEAEDAPDFKIGGEE